MILKKVIFLSAVVGTVFILVTRFVSYKVLEQDVPKPKTECVRGDQPLVDEEGFVIINRLPQCRDIQAINEAYLKAVKPIFAKVCLNCHGSSKTLPLYAKIPPSSFLVQYDLEEAREHMDMRFDFPFQGGHGGLKEDLEAIQEVIEENKMPPWYYLIMHWQSSLEDSEKKAVLKWVRESLETLKK